MPTGVFDATYCLSNELLRKRVPLSYFVYTNFKPTPVITFTHHLIKEILISIYGNTSIYFVFLFTVKNMAASFCITKPQENNDSRSVLKPETYVG